MPTPLTMLPGWGEVMPQPLGLVGIISPWNDPFQLVLLGMTYEKMGQQAKATALYERAYVASTGSNPPNIYSRTFTRQKLGKQ